MSVKFGIITDVHHCNSSEYYYLVVGGGDHRWLKYAATSYENFITAMEARGDIDFCIQTGDWADNKIDDDPAPEVSLAEVVAKNAGFSGDVWSVLGNHERAVWNDATGRGWDLYFGEVDQADPARANKYADGSGEPYKAYTFDVNGMRMIVLDTDDLIDNEMSAGQITWLEGVLNTGLPVVIFSHEHIYAAAALDLGPISNASTVWGKLTAAGNVQAVIQGHSHNAWGGFTRADDIEVFCLRSSVSGPPGGADLGTVYSCYYVFDIIPNAYYGDSRQRANIEVTGYLQGVSKSRETFIIA